MSCVIIGDSLSGQLAQSMAECAPHGHGGYSAADYAHAFPCYEADLTIITLGSNAGPDDGRYLREVRACTKIGRVIWLIPAARDRDLVSKIAAENGDRIIDVRIGGASPEHIHPTRAGYEAIATSIRGLAEK